MAVFNDLSKPVVGGTVQEFYSDFLSGKTLHYRGVQAQWVDGQLLTGGIEIHPRDIRLSDLTIDGAPAVQAPPSQNAA
jgi:hypothetical protein